MPSILIKMIDLTLVDKDGTFESVDKDDKFDKVDTKDTDIN